MNVPKGSPAIGSGQITAASRPPSRSTSLKPASSESASRRGPYPRVDRVRSIRLISPYLVGKGSLVTAGSSPMIGTFIVGSAGRRRRRPPLPRPPPRHEEPQTERRLPRVDVPLSQLEVAGHSPVAWPPGYAPRQGPRGEVRVAGHRVQAPGTGGRRRARRRDVDTLLDVAGLRAPTPRSASTTTAKLMAPWARRRRPSGWMPPGDCAGGPGGPANAGPVVPDSSRPTRRRRRSCQSQRHHPPGGAETAPGGRRSRLRDGGPGRRGLVLGYASPRRLCAFARRSRRGRAAFYGEVVTISQTACMHRGDPAASCAWVFVPDGRRPRGNPVAGSLRP